MHMCPRYILSDNGTELKNRLMDQVFQQLGIDCIFSAPYHPQRNGKLEVFHKYLKPTLKKLWEGSNKLGQIPQTNTCHLQSNTKSCHSGDTIFSCLWQRSQPTTTSTFRINAMLPRWPRIWATQPRRLSTGTSYCKEDIRWELLLECPEDHGQRTTFFETRWQSLL